MIEINFVGVLLAAVLSMVVGFIWYSPSVLGKPWMKAKGYTPEQLKKEQKQMGKYYGMSFIVAIVTAYVLAHVMGLSANTYNYSPVVTGMTSAFWMWLGFVMPVQFSDQVFGEKNWKLLGINTGYQLVALLVMGIAIGML